ncbi:MAG: thioredoxin-dependent thiol peroxidase [Alphaproteobacteria bacterium]
MALKLGDKAPAFTMDSDGGGKISLSDFKGKTLVLYFYPKDDTPGCTKEACGFRDSHAALKRRGVAVLGVSKDSAASHDKFKAKYKLPFALGSDAEIATAKAYGVWVKKTNYGREYMGMERSTFLIDGKGVIRGIWRGVKVNGHVEAVTEAIKAL